MPLRLYKGPWIGSPASETLEAMEELRWSCDCEGSDGLALGEKKSCEEKHKARPRQHAQLSEWNGEVSHCVCTYRPELSEVPEWEDSEWKSEIDFASRRVVIQSEESLTVHSQNVPLSILLRKYGTKSAYDIPRAHRIVAMRQGWRIEISFVFLSLTWDVSELLIKNQVKFASAICWTIGDVCEVDFTGFSSDTSISLGDKFNYTGILLRIKGACTLSWWPNHEWSFRSGQWARLHHFGVQARRWHTHNFRRWL